MTAKWVDIMPAGSLNPGDVQEISFQDNDLLVFRTHSGALRAMDAYCPHMGNYIPNGLKPGQHLASLLRDETLICPFHNWQFDGRGRCSTIPAGQRVPARVKNGDRIGRSWEIRESANGIELGLLRPRSWDTEEESR